MRKLARYQAKRNFNKTSEPRPKVQKRTLSRMPFFVVQKHSARALHYDFRLEVNGVLKSWAVPKGPSKNPKIKRLAVMTEDHPLAYRNFSGTIPKGEYGAGKVEIWDSGTYVKKQKGNLTNAGQKSKFFTESDISSGKLEFELKGKKLKGNWVLFKFGNEKKTWILKKMK